MVLPDGSRGNVVELRVHGVSGTPPEELLDRQLVRQVAGDKTAGFYRPRLREEWRDRPSNDPGNDSEPYSTAEEAIPPPLLEGYSWGGLTSGSPSRALWLVLLPFTLINVAPRLRPVPGNDPQQARRAAWWVWFLGRVMAVSLTATIALGATGVGEAVLAWQCQGICQNLPWPLSAMFYDTSSDWRVLWGACLPLAVLAVLALLSWRNSVQYDLVRPAGMDDRDKQSSEIGTPIEPRLAEPSFWYGRYPVSRLRHLHLQAGVAVVGITLIIAAHPSAVRWIGILLAVLTGTLIVTALGRPELLRRTDPTGRSTAGSSMVDKARNIGAILLIWVPTALLLIIGLLMPPSATDEMPGYDGLVTAWFAGQSALTLVMFALIWSMARAERPRTPQRAMWGMGTVVLTVLALYLGAALTSGFVILSAAWITSSNPWIGIGDVNALLEPDSALKIPTSLQYAGLGTFAVAIVVLIVLLVTVCYVSWMWAVGGTPQDRKHAAEAGERAKQQDPARYAKHRQSTIDRRRKMIARSIWIARRVDYLPAFLAVLVLTIGGIGSVMTLYFGFRLLRGEPLQEVVDLNFWSRFGPGSINPVAVGVWLIGILLVGLVVLEALAFRVPKTRKAVGILWDIGSFWPRDVHPLAPPCYAERAVPELAIRLDAHAALVASGGREQTTASGDARPGAVAELPMPGLVVLASHSQGTVISMAALLGPAWRSADRTVLLTFGTVLRRLYGRFFPLYFSSGAFAELAERLGEPAGADLVVNTWGAQGPGLASTKLRWRNLWRRTDYLGGRVGDPLVDQAPPPEGPAGTVLIDIEFEDPVFLPGRGDTAMPAAGRHSNFPRDPAFQDELMQLLRASFASLDPVADAQSWAAAVPADQPLTSDDLMNPRETMA